MRDALVRQAFHQTVLKPAHSAEDTIVVNELGLKNGMIRADIVVVNGKMVGYEIKTKRDTLQRLPSQVTAYSEVFDEAHIITSCNHLNKVELMIPLWWGIYLIKEESDGIYSFVCHREAAKNEIQKVFTIAQLLWKNEALEVASQYLQCELKPSTSKKEIYKMISNGCTQEQVTKIVIRYLKQRDNWRANHKSPSQNGD